jgi:hypothetical protein
MVGWLRRQVTVANVLALTAVFIALSSTGWAAQVQRTLFAERAADAEHVDGFNASLKPRARTLLALNRKRKLPLSVLPAGLRGPRGPRGRQGEPGRDAEFAGVSAGGALVGSYPDPFLAAGAIDSTAIFAPRSIPAAVVRGAGGGPAVTWATEDADTADLFDPARNTALTASDAGLYEAAVSLTVPGVTQSARVEIVSGGVRAADSGGPGTANLSTSALIPLTAGQEVSVNVVLNGGTVAAAPGSFSMHWVAPN